MALDPRTLQWLFSGQVPDQVIGSLQIGANTPGSLASFLAPSETQYPEGQTAPTTPPLSPLARAQGAADLLNKNAYGSANPMLPGDFPQFNDPRIVQGLLGTMAMNGDQGAADELHRQISGGGGGGWGGGYGGGMGGSDIAADKASDQANNEINS